MNIASGCPMFIRIEHLTEWTLCERWLNIPSSGGRYFRPPKDHPMKTLMNSNLKMNNSVDWNKFWCWHLPSAINLNWPGNKTTTVIKSFCYILVWLWFCKIVVGKYNWTDMQKNLEYQLIIGWWMWTGVIILNIIVSTRTYPSYILVVVPHIQKWT